MAIREPGSAGSRGLDRQSLLFAAMLFAIALAVSVVYQRMSGAYAADMSSLYDDEAPHYLNALLVKTYLTSGLTTNPLTFAQDFYIHYPKVTIGHWPPAFYGLAGIWMALISDSIVSMLVLSAVITAIIAAVVGYVAAGRWHVRSDRQPVRWLAGLLVTLFVCTIPVMRDQTTSLMLDVYIGGLCLAATLVYGRFLRDGAVRWSIAFGLIASLAILSKGNSLLLGLLPPLAILLTNRWSLVRRPAFWIGGLIVVALCGPWILLTYSATANGFLYSWGWAFVAKAMTENARTLLVSIGPVGLALALAAALKPAVLRLPDPDDRHDRMVLLALAMATFIFQGIVPSGSSGAT